jgi:hypothetical protein
MPPNRSEANWIADKKYTLKCDYMEQSHRNNTPTAKYYNEKVIDAVVQNDVTKLSPARQETPPAGVGTAHFQDAIDGFPCLVFYNDNLDLADDLTARTSYTINSPGENYAGSFMFNIDKSGKGLGFELANKHCLSYEGGHNEEISAATFYPYSYFKEHGGASKDTINSEWDYYKKTAEPRYNYYEEVWPEDGPEYDVAQEENGRLAFAPLIRAINWLAELTAIDPSTDVNYEAGEDPAEEKRQAIERFKRELPNYFSYDYCLAYYL